MGNLIVDRVQSREIQQIRYRPRQSWRAGNSASPRTPSIPARKRSCAFLKTHRNPRFKTFSPNESSHFTVTPSASVLSSSVQPRCTSLQNFAFCAMADRLQSPTARLGCRFVCTTSGFAQKKDTRPVGGRGISAFFSKFLFPKLFL